MFATAAYTKVAADIARAGGWDVGCIERKSFADGERYLRIMTHVADRDVVLVGGTISDSDTLELYDLACSIVAQGASRLSLVVPYFGYSTMERAVQVGEVVTAKTRAKLLSSIPAAGRGTQFFLLDLHVAALAHYFEGSTRTVHVYGKPFVLATAARLGGADFVFACTDAGRAKWVESLASDLGVDVAFAYKRRSGDDSMVTGVSAHVRGKRVVIYDDMIRTGGSLLHAAEAYRAAGALSIDAVATHGLFPGDAKARLRASGLFGSITVTDSHPRARELADDFLRVESLAELWVHHIRGNK